MKYDTQINELRNHLNNATNILVALPATLSQDSLAAGLSLLLALSASKKEVSVVTADSPKVSNSGLFGVGQIQNTLPKTSGGNLTLTLEGVVASDGTVPALEKLDWYPQGQNLNLVFHVLPGQRFEPARILPSYAGGDFNLIITIGASSLNALGEIYEQNQQIFSGVSVINIGNKQSNTPFGIVNIVDPESSSISEIVALVMQGLGLPIDADTASNLLNGIYSATSNLTSGVKPDTFMAVGSLVQSGGQIPQGEPGLPSAPIQQNISEPVQTPQSDQIAQPQTVQATPPAPQPTPENWQANFAPLNQVFGFPVQPENTQSNTQQNDNFVVPSVVNETPASENQPSLEERPMGEYVGSSNPEIPSNPDPDWLTPKVYKGVG